MRSWSKLIVLAAAGCVTGLVAGTPLHAAEITVVASGGPLPSVMGAIIPMFERATGNKVKLNTKAGAAIVEDVKQGAADLVIADVGVVEGLATSGDVAAGSATLLMISKVGVAVKAGAPKPDISTADKLKAALLAAKTVGYSQGPSGQHFLTVAERLGIADAVKAKGVIPQGEPVGAAVAKGAAEIGVQQVTELLAVPGIDLVGPLPNDLQTQFRFSAGIPTKAKDAATARALINFMRSAPALAVLKEKGMDLP
jgi:molybdate transport system substrate-binding protein